MAPARAATRHISQLGLLHWGAPSQATTTRASSYKKRECSVQRLALRGVQRGERCSTPRHGTTGHYRRRTAVAVQRRRIGLGRWGAPCQLQSARGRAQGSLGRQATDACAQRPETRRAAQCWRGHLSKAAHRGSCKVARRPGTQRRVRGTKARSQESSRPGLTKERESAVALWITAAQRHAHRHEIQGSNGAREKGGDNAHGWAMV
jgi:hypothetical protein